MFASFQLCLTYITYRESELISPDVGSPKSEEQKADLGHPPATRRF